jgi:hypothetical protein
MTNSYRYKSKKNRQFLAKPARVWYCFSEIPASDAKLLMGDARADCIWVNAANRIGIAPGTGKRLNDSEMAPQAVEISQNGLGDPRLASLSFCA